MSAQWIKECFGEEEFFFIQIGAHVGATAYDPIYPFIREHQAYGILVEPLPPLYAGLLKTYAEYPDLEFENVAISDHEGSVEMHFLDFEKNDLAALPGWASQLASVNPQHVPRHFDRQAADGLVVATLEVSCTRLATLCESHRITTVDLLHVDAEGHDIEVLHSLDFDRVLPGAILWESRHTDGPLKKGSRYLECLDFLSERGYRLVCENDHDSFCILD